MTRLLLGVQRLLIVGIDWFNLSFLVLVLSILTGCQASYKDSNPVDVASEFLERLEGGEIKRAYKLLSDTCKTLLTQSEFESFYETHGDNKNLQSRIIQTSIFPEYPTRRVFEVSSFKLMQTGDTCSSSDYLSAVWTDKGWRIMWSNQWRSVANKYWGQSEFELAIQACRNMIAIDPLDGWAHSQMGWFYYQRDQLDSALAYFNTSKNLRPNDPQVYRLRAGIYRARSQNDLAIFNLDKALDLTCDRESKLIDLGNKAMTASDLERWGIASEAINEALILDSSDVRTWKIYADMLIARGEIDEAFESYERALKCEPVSNHHQHTLFRDYAFALYQWRYKEEDKFIMRTRVLKAKDLLNHAIDIGESSSKIDGTLQAIERDLLLLNFDTNER